jgi:hypothetical protein
MATTEGLTQRLDALGANVAERLRALEMRFGERLSALESTANALVRKSAEDVAEGGVLYNHGTQLGRLEDQLEEDRADFIRRLETLEGKYDEEVDAEEIAREYRWHKAYNAALPHAQRVFEHWAEPERYNRIHMECTAVANRAHGALAAKPDVTESLARAAVEASDKAEEYIDDMHENVNELVQVAREAWHFVAKDLRAKIEAALKPFEAST